MGDTWHGGHSTVQGGSELTREDAAGGLARSDGAGEGSARFETREGTPRGIVGFCPCTKYERKGLASRSPASFVRGVFAGQVVPLPTHTHTLH